MGNLRVARSLLVLGAALGCDNEYPLAPTRCDDYCLATQRGECEEDWPSECVRACELSRSPAHFPNCSAKFDAAVECYEVLDDDDFRCVDDRSEPRAGLCLQETRALEFCIEPFIYRCIALCEDRSERCGEEIYDCLVACQGIPEACEDTAVEWLDCEIADTSACLVSPNCTALSVAVSECIASLP